MGTSRGRSRQRVVLGVAVAVFLVGVLVAVGAVLVPLVGHGTDAAAAPAAAPPPSPPPATTTPPPAPEELDPSRPELVVDETYEAAGSQPSLPWPDSGQAEVTVAGLGGLGHSGSSRAVPIASVAKVMTAYTVLRDHPLSPGRSGPTITVTQAEADAYAAQKANGESVVVVQAGEKLTQRDALKGLLIASGDNMAQVLARWDAGGESAFVARMNRNARRLGMTSTRYADASGLSPRSVSTAHDLVKLAPAAMAQPTLAELVGTRTAAMPLNPALRNYNSLLGLHGVVGIKTGSTTAAGGCLMFAAHRRVGSHTLTVYGAVLGVRGERSAILSNARDAADALVVGAGDALHAITVLHAGRPVASYVDADGRERQLTVKKDYTVAGWSTQTFRITLPKNRRTGRPVTTVTVTGPRTRATLPLVEVSGSA